MAVVFDAQSSADSTANAVTSINHALLTVGSGSNRALVVTLVWSGASPTGISVHWDSAGTNQACTPITNAKASSGTIGTAALYGLIAPTSGNKNLAVSWTGAADVCVACVSYTGVDQTSVAVAFPHGTAATGTTSPATVTVTSATGEAVVACHVTDVTLTAVNNTQVYIDTAPNNISGGANRAAGAATVTMTATVGGATGWASAGTDLLAAGSAASPSVPYMGNNRAQDDPSVWQGSPRALSTALMSALPKNVLRPAFYAPRPADDFIWAPTLDNRNANVLSDLTSQKFFGAGGQVPTKRWRYDNDDEAPVWRGPLDNYNSNVLDSLTAVKFFGAGGQAPTKRWAPFYTHDVVEPIWYPTLENLDASVIPLSSLAKAPTKFWRWDYDVAEPTWYPTLENLDASVIPLSSLAKAPTKLWRWDYDVAESGWQQSNWMGTANFYTILTGGLSFKYPTWAVHQDDLPSWQFFPARNLGLSTASAVPFKLDHWSYSYTVDDPAIWQQPPAYNVNFLTALLPRNVLRPAFYAPRPADDFTWQSVLGRNTNIFGVTAHNPFNYVPWKFGQDDSSSWQFQDRYNLSVAAGIQFPPAFDWIDVTPDDLPGWQFQAPYNFSVAAGVEFLMVFDYVDVTPDDAPSWQGTVFRKNINLSAATTNPFNYIPWKFGIDDSSNWQGSPSSSALLAPVLSAKAPAKLWRWDHDIGETFWRGAPLSSIILVPELAKQPFTYYPWKFGQDDSSVWQWGTAPKANGTIVIPTVAFTILSRQWLFGQDDFANWQFIGHKNPNLSAAAVTPFFSKQWFYTPDDSSGWQQGSVGRNPNLVTIIEPFANLPWQWKFNYDDASGWQGKPAASSLIVPVLAAQSPAKRWLPYYIYDDSSGWQLGPQGRSPLQTPVLSPFVNPPYKFNYDDSSGWQFASRSSSLLVPVLAAQSPAKRWLPHYSYDDSSGWQFGSQGRSPLQVSEAFVNTPWQWKFDYDDSSGWQFNSRGSNLLVPILKAQASAPDWKFQTRPLDDPFWQFLGQLNVNVTNRPKIVNPPILNWSHSTAQDDASVWQGYYQRNGVLVPVQFRLITDPRFISSPLPTRPALFSVGGAGRLFVTTAFPRVLVTTPVSRFPSMPYGNDFSVIDPTVEQVTTTFNFDPWLAAGETITSIISITVTNSEFSLTQDPNPSGIIFGAPQIGPVPPTSPGVPSGGANRAVLQQVANCQPGVVYLLQCLVATSNNQKLNLANHLPCNPLI